MKQENIERKQKNKKIIKLICDIIAYSFSIIMALLLLIGGCASSHTSTNDNNNKEPQNDNNAKLLNRAINTNVEDIYYNHNEFITSGLYLDYYETIDMTATELKVFLTGGFDFQYGFMGWGNGLDASASVDLHIYYDTEDIEIKNVWYIDTIRTEIRFYHTDDTTSEYYFANGYTYRVEFTINAGKIYNNGAFIYFVKKAHYINNLTFEPALYKDFYIPENVSIAGLMSYYDSNNNKYVALSVSNGVIEFSRLTNYELNPVYLTGNLYGDYYYYKNAYRVFHNIVFSRLAFEYIKEYFYYDNVANYYGTYQIDYSKLFDTITTPTYDLIDSDLSDYQKAENSKVYYNSNWSEMPLTELLEFETDYYINNIFRTRIVIKYRYDKVYSVMSNPNLNIMEEETYTWLSVQIYGRNNTLQEYYNIIKVETEHNSTFGSMAYKGGLYFHFEDFKGTKWNFTSDINSVDKCIISFKDNIFKRDNWLLINYTTPQYIYMDTPLDNGIYGFFDIFGIVLVQISPLFEYQILPGLTVGFFVFLPLVITTIVFIIWLFKR